MGVMGHDVVVDRIVNRGVDKTSSIKLNQAQLLQDFWRASQEMKTIGHRA